jgi:hypothetical protein
MTATFPFKRGSRDIRVATFIVDIIDVDVDVECAIFYCDDVTIVIIDKNNSQ